ncbi:MAG: class I SAM-dependent DNA methyltransferase [Azonexus sp.]
MTTLTPQAFVDKWRHTELKERAACQEHFLDLCHLIGHPTPAEDDPTGERFAFEYGAAKQDGGQGFADVFKRGFFGWEYKGKHANLDKAYGQLLQYRSDLLNPPLLVACDMDRIVIHTNFTNTVHAVTTLALSDLLTTAGLQQLRAIFYDPDSFKVAQTTDQVTRQAAEEFAQLAELLRAYGTPPQTAAHFLIRVLFCLFSEDVRLLPDRLFTRIVTQSRQRPGSFVPQVQQLFQTMATGGFFGADEIKHFNGRLFDNATVLDLDSDSLDILRRISTLDWSNIEPSIFGTLFTRSLDPARRAQLGAQYTSREDILLILEPVLMTPLRRRWAEIQAQAQDLAAQRRTTAAGAQKTKLDRQLRDLLIGFATELAQISVLDPACGSGNFLYVSLVLLLDLWKEVSNLLAELGFSRLMPTPDVSPSPLQLHGIEKDEYAHELAQTTIWIGYIQWFIQNGFGFPPEPILRPIDTVVQMDAILAFDEQGQPIEPEWPAATVVVGNPPFVGGNRIRQELGDKYVDALFLLYKGRIPAFADLVCYWFEKARAMIAASQAKRAGLLATQAIRGGVNRKVLEGILETGGIFWAQSDRNWILDGATVHVSMVGFDSGAESTHVLNGAAVPNINANLTARLDLTRARELAENEKICFIGTKKAGAFDIDAKFAEDLLKAPLNPHGRPNSDVVFPWLNGKTIAGREPARWIISFGELSQSEASLYEAPFEYVRANIYPERQKNNEERARVKWWQHRRPATEMRGAVVKLRQYIATPRVSKHRLFVWVPPNIVPDDGIYVFAREDSYFFGILHSKPHEIWARGQGTQLREAESGFRYTPTSCFETFPFPWPPGKETEDDPRVQAIAQSAKELVQLRDAWINPPGTSESDLKKRTLTNLYNARPTWLDNAHRNLDTAVFAAYGWPADLSDDEILSRLLALNLERGQTERDSRDD